MSPSITANGAPWGRAGGAAPHWIWSWVSMVRRAGSSLGGYCATRTEAVARSTVVAMIVLIALLRLTLVTALLTPHSSLLFLLFPLTSHFSRCSVSRLPAHSPPITA